MIRPVFSVANGSYWFRQVDDDGAEKLHGPFLRPADADEARRKAIQAENPRAVRGPTPEGQAIIDHVMKVAHIPGSLPEQPPRSEKVKTVTETYAEQAAKLLQPRPYGIPEQLVQIAQVYALLAIADSLNTLGLALNATGVALVQVPPGEVVHPPGTAGP